MAMSRGRRYLLYAVVVLTLVLVPYLYISRAFFFGHKVVYVRLEVQLDYTGNGSGRNISTYNGEHCGFIWENDGRVEYLENREGRFPTDAKLILDGGYRYLYEPHPYDLSSDLEYILREGDDEVRLPAKATPSMVVAVFSLSGGTLVVNGTRVEAGETHVHEVSYPVDDQNGTITEYITLENIGSTRAYEVGISGGCA